VRRRGFRAMLAVSPSSKGRQLPVELVMRVSREGDDRLTGTVRKKGGSDVRDFSGMLELMRVFEDLVPVDCPRPNTAAGEMNSRGALAMKVNKRRGQL
jgi:hypothetical protein